VSFPNEKGGRIYWEDESSNELLAKELSTSGASGMERLGLRKVKVRCYGIVGGLYEWWKAMTHVVTRSCEPRLGSPVRFAIMDRCINRILIHPGTGDIFGIRMWNKNLVSQINRT
jgi:hypothetical protein